MNYDAMTTEELATETERLRGEIQLLKIARRGCARAIEARATKEQAIKDLARLGPERVKAMAQVLGAQSVESQAAVGTLGVAGS